MRRICERQARAAAMPVAALSVTVLALGVLIMGCGSADPPKADQTTAAVDQTTTTLAGTWDIITTDRAGTVSGTIILSADGLQISYDGTNAAATLSTGTGTWTSSGRTHGVSFTHSGATSAGAIPFSLGGAWTFVSTESSEDRCTAKLTADSFSNTCNVPEVRLPWLERIATQMSAQRTASASSIFGDLGGQWALVAGTAHCAASFSGNVFKVGCSRGNHPPDSITATVTGNMVSGVSDSGFEFTAKRR
jgi:hypothetical protein